LLPASIIRGGATRPRPANRDAGSRGGSPGAGHAPVACDNRRVPPPPSAPSAAPARFPAHASPFLLLTLTPFFWSCNWIVGRGLHAEIPPMAMTFFRWLFALVILAPFALPQVRRDWPILRRNWKAMLLLGVVGVGTHNALAYLGLNYTTATNGVILNSFIPVMIIALSWIILRERLLPLQLAGVAVSLAGVLAILSQGSLAALVGFRLNGGDLLIILSMAMWSVYTIGLRWKPDGLGILTFLFVLACIGDAAVLPLWLAEMAFGRQMHWTAMNFLALASVALFSSVLAYLFWNRGVEQVGANVAGLFVHLMPVFGIVLAWLFLGERLEVYHVAGIALILAGIWVTSHFRANRAPAVPAATD
jgi:drug/metabolite transporter (DMT)-like permease